MLTNNGYIINKKELTKPKITQILKDLTVSPKVNEGYQTDAESFTVYKEDKDTLTIPRYYAAKKIGEPKDCIDINNSHVDFEFVGKLRDYQQTLVDDVLKTIKSSGGGILQLHTGYGKTTIALYLASVLKLKTLIIVHKTFLQDQWYDRIKQFTNASIGIIRQKKVDVEGKDIVIGMLQSISMIVYDQSIFKDFQLVICDECFLAHTQIITDKGSYTIKELYDLWNNNQELPLIKSYNEKTKMFEFKKMTHAWEKTTTELIKLKFTTHEITCTPNHKFLTSNGYKEAKYLIPNKDMLVNGSNNNTLMCTVNGIYDNRIIGKEFLFNTNDTLVYDIEVEDNHNFMVTDKNNDYGTVVHNCHHMGSKVFSQALLKVFPKYTIGLSATPKRQDGLTKVIKWFLGDIIAKVERKGTNAVYIKSFNYSSTDKLFVEKKRWFKGKVKPDPTKMVSNLCIINDRNLFIANIINSLRKKDERKTLILSGRIEHLKTLKKLVEKLIQDDIKSGNCDTDEVKTAFYIGGMKDYELKDSAEADIIFATYSMAEEGLDIDGLNTLILATPKKNIIQSIGRIMRKPIKEGDVNPLIVDIIDDLSVFPNWSNPRTKYYKTNKYTIHEYKAMNDKMISLKDYMVKHNLIKNITPDVDFRKEYIVSKYGLDEYNFQKDTDFYDFPDEIFNYSCNLNDIFEIKHNYEEEIKEMTITI